MRVWRYSIPSENLEGWAVLFVDASGTVAAVSDFGNYAYVWGRGCLPEGVTILEFLLRVESGYLLEKFAPEKVLDKAATCRAIRKYLADWAALSDPAAIREEMALLPESDEAFDFRQWCEDTAVEAGELAVFGHHPQALAFIERCWPRLRALIQAELEAERWPPDGTPGVRDADATCAHFAPGAPAGDCGGDGHCLCKECRRKVPAE
jgi:hypothetical protein